jgi:conjugative relaxase-like TrwC/TraI family protein
VEYFREHMVGDYLSESGRAQMTWQGRDAKRLGLGGACQLEDFETLCAGRHPATGDKLMVRDKGAHRRVCFFAQISAPKDVSAAYLVAGDKRIAGWWNEAVRETLAEIEAVTATRVRRGGVNTDRVTGSMIAAVVTHDANRALDPQLHTHVCVMNLTYDQSEARWKSVQPSAFYRHQGYFREVCYNKLAGQMLAAGYRLEKARGIGFNIQGFPPELRDKFSKRRREILHRAAETGASSQDELQAITARSRAAKTKATAEELRSGWIKEAGGLLDTARAVVASTHNRATPPTGMAPQDAMVSAAAHVFERRSVVDERVLLREALIAGRGRVELQPLKTAAEARISAGDLLRQGGDVASRESLQAEDEFVTWAEANRSGRPVLGNAAAAEGLAADQAAAVASVLQSRSGVIVFQGDAGTGKTTSLKTIVAGIEAAGGRVFGCAPSAGATDVLRRELTGDADTLKQLLVNPALQAATRGRVVIVDEAGLVSVREMRDLCRLAAANQNRLLLVGDVKQHASVEAGDAVRCLQKYARVPVVRLTQIRRQRDPQLRAAVSRLARGDAVGALAQFHRLGAVEVERDHGRLFAKAADDYVRTVRAGQSCLVISPVWAEIHEFTKGVRERLKATGLLATEERIVPVVFPLKWTREERRRTENYRPGDVLTFHRSGHGYEKHEHVTVARSEANVLVVVRADGQERRLDPRRTTNYGVGLAQELGVAAGERLLVRANLKPSGLKNGDLVEVASFGERGSILLKDGRELPGWFREFSHGYASTSHSAQGKTVDRGILIMADDGIAAGNLKQAYVSNSRFRESQMIYTTDLKAARESMQRPGDRMLASELVPRAKPKSGFRQFFLSRLYRGGRPGAKAMLRGYPDALPGASAKVASGRN